MYWRHLIFCVCKWHVLNALSFREYLFINSSQTFWTGFPGLFLCVQVIRKLSPSSYHLWKHAHLLRQLCSQCSVTKRELLRAQSPTLRLLYPRLSTRTVSCPCCHRSRQPCRSEGGAGALGSGREALPRALLQVAILACPPGSGSQMVGLQLGLWDLTNRQV